MTAQMTESSTLLENLLQVVHDVRQPLSGIENVAFMLEMASRGDDPKTVARFEQLRNLVDQANWILEDAVRAAQIPEAHLSPQDVCQLLRTYAAKLSLREDRSVSLRLPQQPVIVPLDRVVVERMLEWVLLFMHSVAQSGDSPEIRCIESRNHARITLTLAPGERDVSMLAELLDPRTRTGHLRCLTNALGVHLQVGESGSGGLAVAMEYPLA